MITRKKFLSEDELEELIRRCEKYNHERDSILIRLSLFSGARSCEILALKRGDLHEKETAITIHGAKGSNDRTVPLPAAFFKVLKEYADAFSEDERLFPFSTRHYRRIWDTWRSSRKPKLHGLRHTFGIKFYDNSRNIHATKTFLGHKNIKNTMVYLDFIEGAEQLRAGADGMWQKKSS